MKVGSGPQDDCGPVISRASLDRLLAAVDGAVARGARRADRRPRRGVARARLLHGADDSRERLARRRDLAAGAVRADHLPLSRRGLRRGASRLANATSFGLTGAIHTSNSNRIEQFIARYRAGLVSINGPTYGAGPHMPFGGVKNSGNGFREPGTESLDVYCEWKTIVVNHDPAARLTMTTMFASTTRKTPQNGKRRICFPITSRAYYGRSQLLLQEAARASRASSSS